jgi:CYTH domain-containing protein
MTVRHPRVDGQRVETRRNVPSREFEVLKSQSDPSRYPVNKIRRCFIHKDKYFQLDYYTSPHQGLVMLEAYLDHDVDFKAFLPDWLKVEDVTEDKTYSMYHLSLMNQ